MKTHAAQKEENIDSHEGEKAVAGLTVVPNDPQLKILKGREVTMQLSEPDFLCEWDALYNSCFWSSVFQGRAFVTTWYQLYQQQYLPILVKAIREGKLVGLLTLAKDKKSNNIYVAGVREAHYQVWLADPDYGVDFIKKALTLLLTQFPRHSINFYNTPPGTPLAWTLEDSSWKRYCAVRAFQRPLMDFTDQSIGQKINTRRLRKSLNQLKRLGSVNFEHITKYEDYAKVLDTLIELYDFRKGAVYNVTEFRDNPNKKQFLLNLFKQGLLYVTVLKVNNEVIAAITDVLGKNNWVHGTEMSTHSCSFARYSPGILNFMLLGQQLKQKGFSVYDLTPGSDIYKARLANSYDQVHELCVAGAAKTFTRKLLLQPIRNTMRALLHHSNLKPKALKDRYRRYLNRVQAISPEMLLPQVLRKLALSFLSKKLNVCTVKPQITPLALDIKKGSLNDLLSYDPNGGKINRWDFLAEAMSKLEAGKQPYTLTQNGCLLACCWVGGSQKDSVNIEQLSLSATLVEGIYCHKNSMSILHEFLANTSALVLQEENINRVYFNFEDASIRH